jgi:hypothetical protein
VIFPEIVKVPLSTVIDGAVPAENVNDAIVIGATALKVAAALAATVTSSSARIGVTPSVSPLLSPTTTVMSFAIVKSIAFASFIFVKIDVETNAVVKRQVSFLDKNLFLVMEV